MVEILSDSVFDDEGVDASAEGGQVGGAGAGGLILSVLHADLLGKVMACVGCFQIRKASLACKDFAEACRSQNVWTLLCQTRGWGFRLQQLQRASTGGKGSEGEEEEEMNARDTFRALLHAGV